MAQRAEAIREILRRAFIQNPDAKAILFHESIDAVMALFGCSEARGIQWLPSIASFQTRCGLNPCDCSDWERPA